MTMTYHVDKAEIPDRESRRSHHRKGLRRRLLDAARCPRGQRESLRTRMNCRLSPTSAPRRVRRSVLEDKPGSVRNPARLSCRFASSRCTRVSSSSRSSRKAGRLSGRQERTRADHSGALLHLQRTIRMSTSSSREPAPTAARGSRAMNGALTATTTRVTAGSFSWPTTTGTISRARSCGRTSSACTFTTT